MVPFFLLLPFDLVCQIVIFFELCQFPSLLHHSYYLTLSAKSLSAFPQVPEDLVAKLFTLANPHCVGFVPGLCPDFHAATPLSNTFFNMLKGIPDFFALSRSTSSVSPSFINTNSTASASSAISLTQ